MTDDTKTSDLPLPLRTRNALEKHGLTTWREVNEVEDLRAIPGLGQKGADAILELMRAETLFEAPAQVTELPTPEESIARANGGRHTVASMIDQAMRGGLERFELSGFETAERAPRWTDGRMVDPIEEIRARTVDFRARGGSVSASAGSDASKLLVLRLEEDIQARIRALIPTIKGLPHVKELGVEVSAETVGRMALIRGLDLLEKAHGGAKSTSKTPENGDPRAPAPENADAPLPTGDEEVYDTPEGWSRVGHGEAIPVPEAVLHDYYSQNGWNRYWGKANDQVIYFYWSPERRLQDLKPFPGTDKSGRTVGIQETPWGPGHVVPHKWANS